MARALTWVNVPQEINWARVVAGGIAGMVSPTHRGMSLLSINGAIPNTGLYTVEDVQPWVGVVKWWDNDSHRRLRLSIHTPERPYAFITWHERDGNDAGSWLDLESSDQDVATVARGVLTTFGRERLHRPVTEDEALALVTEALTRRLTGQAELVARMEQLFDLPEHVERIDRRILIGPDGPELDYPARALGPTEVCTPLDGLAVVRAAPGNLNDAAIFAMAWSRYINPAWAIAEITRTEEEASVRLYRSGSARALKVWNPRWRLAPPAPPGVDDLFAQEMARSATWTWDHSQMTALAREDRIDHPLDHLCHVLRIPSIEPLLADAWPPDIAPGLRRYPYEPEARFRRVRAWTGAKLKLGRWRRRFQSKDRPPEPPAAG